MNTWWNLRKHSSRPEGSESESNGIAGVRVLQDMWVIGSNSCTAPALDVKQVNITYIISFWLTSGKKRERWTVEMNSWRKLTRITAHYVALQADPQEVAIRQGKKKKKKKKKKEKKKKKVDWVVLHRISQEAMKCSVAESRLFYISFYITLHYKEQDDRAKMQN